MYNLVRASNNELLKKIDGDVSYANKEKMKLEKQINSKVYIYQTF